MGLRGFIKMGLRGIIKMGLRPKPPASPSGDPFAPRRACRAALCTACTDGRAGIIATDLPRIP